jgi:putative sigma-54 modulation protein
MIPLAFLQSVSDNKSGKNQQILTKKTMEIKIKSKNLTLSDKQKEAIESKVSKLYKLADRLSDESTEFRVEIKHEKSRRAEDAFACELTIFAPGSVIRAETKNETIENAVDECMDKIKKQISRYKSKVEHLDKKSAHALEIDETEKEDGFEIPNILRRKRFTDSRPMTEEEAIEKMELIGHSFFLFNNSDTQRFSIVYKRNDGYYGIVEPKMPND